MAKSKLKTPDWILEGYDSEEAYLKKKGKIESVSSLYSEIDGFCRENSYRLFPSSPGYTSFERVISDLMKTNNIMFSEDCKSRIVLKYCNHISKEEEW